MAIDFIIMLFSITMKKRSGTVYIEMGYKKYSLIVLLKFKQTACPYHNII